MTHPEEQTTGQSWAEFAEARIREAGLKRSGPRQRVIEVLDEKDCAITALALDAELKDVGRATVYRAIEQLEELGLILRVDLGGSAYGYEKVEPSGHHHHHIVCDDCGRVEPFENDALEEAIHEIRPAGSSWRPTRSPSTGIAPTVPPESAPHLPRPKLCRLTSRITREERPKKKPSRAATVSGQSVSPSFSVSASRLRSVRIRRGALDPLAARVLTGRGF